MPATIAALTLLVAGAVAFAATTTDCPLDIEWIGAAAAAASGGTLWALAGVPRGHEPLYADVLARIASPTYRTAARVLVLVTAPLAGAGVAAYAATALSLTLTGAREARRPIDWRASVGTGLIGVAVVLVALAAGLPADEAVLWSVLLTGSGLALFWTATVDAEPEARDTGTDHAMTRTHVGFLLVAAGATLILNRTGGFGLDARTIVGAIAVVAVAALVIVPRWLRNRRRLQAERRLREREQERAEMAEMLHDSVLQTLALIQRRGDVPDEVAGLARRQERELRNWLLHGERAGEAATSFDEALRKVVAEVEDDHGVAIEAVLVGDTGLSPSVQALISAAREALVNAAKHGAGAPISLFAKAREGTVDVFVHDRGPGFDPEAIDPARRGVRDSILGRMRRIGGHAHIRASPGGGCEVTLRVRTDG
jgi:signal transduction histidine kinase